MKVRLEFKGGAEMAKALEQCSQRIAKAIQRNALVDAAEPMRARMAQLAPHDPGGIDLKENITISRARGEDVQETAVAIGPSKTVWYGGFPEFGTVHQPPQPYVRPAFDELRDTTLQQLAANLWAALASRGLLK